MGVGGEVAGKRKKRRREGKIREPELSGNTTKLGGGQYCTLVLAVLTYLTRLTKYSHSRYCRHAPPRRSGPKASSPAVTQ